MGQRPSLPLVAPQEAASAVRPYWRRPELPATFLRTLRRDDICSYVAEVGAQLKSHQVATTTPTPVAVTKLSLYLQEARPAKAGPLDAFRLARRAFIAGERIDMGALATEVGVDRATLFRWVGNREQLLSEVIWSVCVPTWHRAMDEATGVGPERVVAVFTAFTEAVIASEFFRIYLRRERDRALKLLTTRAGVHQSRMTDLFEALLTAEAHSSRMQLPLPASDLAYVMVRVAESFIYSDLIIGEEPDAAKAAAVIVTLLKASAPHT
jgi:Tetracyclin repressor-like, C-terminal domain